MESETDSLHPLRSLWTWLSEMDFAVLGHGFTPDGRDYYLHVQDCLGSDPGEHLLQFTHVVRADLETRVCDDVWKRSWDDVFLSYEGWLSAGEPDGYVWGTNWSNAYPGISAVEDSDLAKEWSARLNKPFFEAILETDGFWLRLIFHSISSRKTSDDTKVISSVTMPVDTLRSRSPDED